MIPETNMTLEVLKANYGPWMDWERHTTIVREALAFWHSLKQVFLKVQDIFLANQGYGHHSVFGWMNCQIGALFQRSFHEFLP